MLIVLFVLALCGLFMCVYGNYIERMLEKDSNYRPFCDLSDRISCTKTFKSSYGSLLGVKNTWIGIFFYTTICMFSQLDMIVPIFYISLCGVLTSACLAYLLIYKIKTYCPLCIMIYVINSALLIISYRTL